MEQSERYLDDMHCSRRLGKVEYVAIRGQSGIVRAGDPVAYFVAKVVVSTGVDKEVTVSIVGMISGEDFATKLDELLEVALIFDVFGVEGQAIEVKAVDAGSAA